MINVNLLPPEIKNEIIEAKKNAQSLRYVRTLMLVLLAAFLLALGSFFLLKLQYSNVSISLAQKEKEIDKYGNLEEEAKRVAERLTTIKTIDNNTYKWSGVVEEVQKTVPEGVYLTQIRMDAAPKSRNQLAGVALSKKEVAYFRDSLEKSNKFEFVDIESSTTSLNPQTKKETESFTITFSLSKEALK